MNKAIQPPSHLKSLTMAIILGLSVCASSKTTTDTKHKLKEIFSKSHHQSLSQEYTNAIVALFNGTAHSTTKTIKAHQCRTSDLV